MQIAGLDPGACSVENLEALERGRQVQRNTLIEAGTITRHMELRQ
jgi:hypothetical protein